MRIFGYPFVFPLADGDADFAVSEITQGSFLGVDPPAVPPVIAQVDNLVAVDDTLSAEWLRDRPVALPRRQFQNVITETFVDQAVDVTHTAEGHTAQRAQDLPRIHLLDGTLVAVARTIEVVEVAFCGSSELAVEAALVINPFELQLGASTSSQLDLELFRRLPGTNRRVGCSSSSAVKMSSSPTEGGVALNHRASRRSAVPHRSGGAQW